MNKKLTKLGVTNVEIWRRYDSMEEYDHPSIQVSCETTGRRVSIEFQRNRLDFASVFARKDTAQDIIMYRKALEEPTARLWDVGAAPYSLTYGPSISRLYFETYDVEWLAGLSKLLSDTKAAVTSRDQLTVMHQKFVTLGADCKVRYFGKYGEKDNLFDIDEAYCGQLKKWAYRAEASRIVAQYELDRAERLEAEAQVNSNQGGGVMGKVNVEVEEIVDDMKKALEQSLKNHDTGNCPIDIDDCDAVGEHIKEQGWTAYDLSIDLEDFAEQDQLAAACNVGAVVNEHGLKDVIESCVDHEGIGDVLTEVMKHADSSEVIHAMVNRWNAGSVFESVLGRIDLNDDDVFEELLNRDADILKSLGQKNVMNTLEALGWLPAGPAPDPIPTKVIGDLEWTDKVWELNWYDACAKANQMGDGWRLPTVQELVSLFNYDTCTCLHFSPMAYGPFWSSQTDNDDNAWTVGMSSGTVLREDKSLPMGMRIVRNVKKEENNA